MFYYLYEIRNNLNGKIYVGVHKTKDLNDGYMGSGKVIQSAINKHGIENFTKVILEQFDDSVAMYAREKEVVTEEFLARDDVYNLRRGGSGGFDYINKNSLNFSSENWKNYVSSGSLAKNGRLGAEASKDIPFDVRSANSKQAWIDHREKMIAASEEKIKKMSSPEILAKKKEKFKLIGHQQGEKHSQFGTCWMWHELIGNKKCKKDMLPLFIEQGWIKGRFSVR